MGPEFLDKLGEIPPKKLIEAFNETVSPIDTSTQIGKISNELTIPEHQLHLKQIVDELIFVSPYESNIELGAYKMYNFLESNWMHMYPEKPHLI